MASNVLENLDQSMGGRPSHAEYGGDRTVYVFDEYGNISRRPYNISRSYSSRNGGGGYASSGYASDVNRSQYYQPHRSPYAPTPVADPSGRRGGDRYRDDYGSGSTDKVEMRNWGTNSGVNSKGKEGSKNSAGRADISHQQHHMSDVSDMENAPALKDDIFSLKQAVGEYRPAIQQEARHGLLPEPIAAGEWTPMRASGLCQEIVMTWNGSCAQFGERKIMPRKNAGGGEGARELDPTIFHYNKDLAKRDLHAGRDYEIAQLHPFEQNMLALNAEKGAIQPLSLKVYDYQNPFSFPVGVRWPGFELANRVRYGNVNERYMMVLQPGGRMLETRVIDFRPYLNRDDMQLAASIRSTQINGDIMTTPGSDRVAVNQNSLLFDCILGYSQAGKLNIDWEETSTFTQNEETYVANLPRQDVNFCVNEIQKKIRVKSSNISLNNMHWTLHALNPAGDFCDHYQTELEWMAKNNDTLYDEKVRAPQMVTLSADLTYI